MVEACRDLGYEIELTGWNHWDVAIATSQANHPYARHFCAGIDNVNPRDHYAEGELDILWASPECTHHSIARGGKPINDQSRATAFCVTRWAEALRPPIILVENVKEFQTWGPIGSNGRPLKNRRGEIFYSWIRCLEAIGYRVEWRVLCAADYGDPTTRERLFVYAVRGKRKIFWPEPTHAEIEIPDMFTQRTRWLSTHDHVIDWSIPTPSIFTRKRPLAEKTIRRINEGLEEHGSPIIIGMEHGGRVFPTSRPMPVITTAKGGAFGLAYLLPQQSGGKLRSADKPCPTVSTAGAIALIIEYYGNGRALQTDRPLPTVTCRDRFGMVTTDGVDVCFRMLRPHELAAAQGFPKGYIFCGKNRKRGIIPNGNTTDIVKQIGNAVPKNLAKALVRAALTQSSI